MTTPQTTPELLAMAQEAGARVSAEHRPADDPLVSMDLNTLAAFVVRVTAAPQEGVSAPFDCWSTNNGDSWYEDPADAQIIQDLLGHNPSVGEEYCVLAGWTAVNAIYRVTSVGPDGDVEAECISHPRPAAPQPPASALPDMGNVGAKK